MLITMATSRQKLRQFSSSRTSSLDQDLTQYLDKYNPRALWDALKWRYHHLRLISLPFARNDWIHLCVLDHPTIASYNSALFRVTSQLKVCRHPIFELDQIEKTFSTFPAASMTLSQQYRQMHFIEYADRIASHHATGGALRSSQVLQSLFFRCNEVERRVSVWLGGDCWLLQD